MVSRTNLANWGLTPNDIQDLDKDAELKNVSQLRDLIMSLYLRAVHSEEKVEKLWNSIDDIKGKTVILSCCCFMLGLASGICLSIAMY